MKGFPVGPACAGLVFLTGLVIAAAEVLGAVLNLAIRIPIYAGGLAGIAIGIGGLLFAVKLSNLKRGSDAGFWKWWGTGMLTRLFLLLGFSMLLAWQFKNQMTAALLAMAVIYLMSMFAEAAWLAKVFFTTDNQ